MLFRIYDGNSESSAVIGTFCGIGRFPFSIVGTGTDLLLEFVSSAAGKSNSKKIAKYHSNILIKLITKNLLQTRSVAEQWVSFQR